MGLLQSPSFLNAAEVKLVWDANDPAEGVDGYRIYWGNESGNYCCWLDVGNVTESGIIDIPYFSYIAATAYKICTQEDVNSIDGGALTEDCDQMISFNGIPRCGKYPGDLPDIGPLEWFPGVTADNPKGDWNGIPLNCNPLEYPDCAEVNPCREVGQLIESDYSEEVYFAWVSKATNGFISYSWIEQPQPESGGQIEIQILPDGSPLIVLPDSGGGESLEFR